MKLDKKNHHSWFKTRELFKSFERNISQLKSSAEAVTFVAEKIFYGYVIFTTLRSSLTSNISFLRNIVWDSPNINMGKVKAIGIHNNWDIQNSLYLPLKLPHKLLAISLELIIIIWGSEWYVSDHIKVIYLRSCGTEI